MPPQQIAFKALIHPLLKGQITLLLWSHTRTHYSRHSPALVHTVTEPATLEGASHTSSHHSSLCHPSADGHSEYPSNHNNNRHSHTLSHTHHFSHRGHSHYSTDQSQSYPSSSHHTAQYLLPRKMKQCPRASTTINPTTPKLSPSRILLRTPPQILTVTLIL